mmetsp:Transcript_24245/g.69726  ORF Transcript_24245/g.69726 Transcript_24245/m.69726 type:complete len:239 (-) Transcript_24245:398-1114(-)
MGFFKNGSKKSGEGGEVPPTAVAAAAASPTPAPVSTSASEAPAATAGASGRPPTSPSASAGGAAASTSPTGAAAAPASIPPTNYDTDGGNRTDGAETDEEGAVDDLDGKELDEDLEWDEGGPSQCGYSEPVHGVLMSAGAAIHRVVGDPGEGVKVGMRRIGNFFQEASYAVRDVVRGDAGVKDDARNAWKEMVGAHEGEDGEGGVGPGEEEEGKENGGSATAAAASSPAASPTGAAAN